MDLPGVVPVGWSIMFVVTQSNASFVVFVNPLIMRIENLKIVTLSGVFIMSLGLILASFSTRVGVIHPAH